MESLTDETGPQYIEESFPGELLESAFVYVDPEHRMTYDGRRGDRVQDLPDHAIRVPRTIWF